MDIYGDKTIAMRHFFAGIGEIPFWLFLLYLTMSTSPIIGLVIGLTKINPINSIHNLLFDAFYKKSTT